MTNDEAVNGRHMLDRGVPEGRLVGQALKAALWMIDTAGMSRERALDEIDMAVKHPNPEAMLEYWGVAENSTPLAVFLLSLADHNRREERRYAHQPHEVPSPFQVYGRDLIDEAAMEQMETAMRLPVTKAGALMPDAHLGYGLPIGGVWATDGVVSPNAVGVDIGCQVHLTVFDVDVEDAPKHTALRDALLSNTRFGKGASFHGDDKRYHHILDESLWRDHPLLKQGDLRAVAHEQLGTSGGGNHFAEVGVVDTGGKQLLALLTHSGSRSLGSKIAKHYSTEARKACDFLPKEFQDLAWLHLDDELGMEYWTAMHHAVAYARANHEVIHRTFAAQLGVEPWKEVNSVHNTADIEQIDPLMPDKAVVHRKGATPVKPGEFSIIPGSMVDGAVIVEGTHVIDDRICSLNSASHGAGRVMSRRQAHKELEGFNLYEYLRERGITLIGSDLDEAPQAYKSIHDVMKAQSDLVTAVNWFTPMIVRMA